MIALNIVLSTIIIVLKPWYRFVSNFSGMILTSTKVLQLMLLGSKCFPWWGTCFIKTYVGITFKNLFGQKSACLPNCQLIRSLRWAIKGHQNSLVWIQPFSTLISTIFFPDLKIFVLHLRLIKFFENAHLFQVSLVKTIRSIKCCSCPIQFEVDQCCVSSMLSSWLFLTW